MSVDVPNVTLFTNQDPYFIVSVQAQPNLGALITLTTAINALPYAATLISSTQLILNLGFVPASVNTSNSQYTISGPSSITVASVVYNPGDIFITVNVTGTFVAGNYFVSLGPNTFFDLSGNFNSTAATPIMIATPPTMQFVSSTGGVSVVHLTYSLPPTLSGAALIPANWLITGGGIHVTVTAVGTSGNDILLTVTPQTQGATYTATMPAGISGLSGSTPIALSGAFTANFTGTGTAPTIVIAFPESDGKLVDVIFNESVVTSEAMIAANYSIDHSLVVFSVDQINLNSYRLHTSLQTAGTVYTLTVSNIHDLQGNLI